MRLAHWGSLLIVLLTSGTAAAQKTKLEDQPKPDKKASIRDWTPTQQYMPPSSYGNYGYYDAYGAMVLADELGDKLSASGRISLVETCFSDNTKPDARAALLWAVCSADVAAADLAKFEAELTAANVRDDDRKEIVGRAAKVLESAKKVGAAVLALGTDARAEWAAYASSHKDLLALVNTLQDAVRANKDGLAPDCMKTVAAPFQKLIHAATFPFEEDGDPMDFYYRHLPATTDAYITALGYAACALSLTTVGKGPYTVVANRAMEGVNPARRGPRSLTMAKAYDKTFKPRFSDRDLSFEDMRREIRGGLRLPGTDLVSSIGTPKTGTVATMTRADDMTKLTFAGDMVESCVDWRETTKVASVSHGNVTYEKECKKRAMVPSQARPAEIPTVFIAGIAKGVDVMSVFGFPVVAWKGTTLTAVWGVPK